MGEKTKMVRMAFAVIFALALGSWGVSLAAEAGPAAPKTATGSVTGEITVIGRNTISVLYSEDKGKGIEYEMVVPIDSDIRLEHKKNITDFKVGDTVTINYEDTTTGDSDKNLKTERKAKVISFVKAVVKKLEPTRPPEPGEGIPDDPQFKK